MSCHAWSAGWVDIAVSLKGDSFLPRVIFNGGVFLSGFSLFVYLWVVCVFF